MSLSIFGIGDLSEEERRAGVRVLDPNRASYEEAR
jgi:hypothetical protein